MDIVVALRAQALQHEVAVETGEAAKLVAREEHVGKGLLFLHEIFQRLEAHEVGAVEVVGLGNGELCFRGRRGYLADNGIGHGVEHGAHDSEEEKHVDNGEEEDIYGKPDEIEIERQDNEVKAHDAERRAIGYEVARELEAAHQAMRQKEDVGDVVARKSQGGETQQDIAAEEVLPHIAQFVHAGKAAAE